MRHRRKVKKLGRTAAHRNAMVRNLVAGLFSATPTDEGLRRVRTTVPKAKAAKPLAERLITLGKRGTLHARRRALALLPNKRVVKTLFEDIAPLYNDRNGGYTRVVRLPAFRRGDGAELCYLELVTGPVARSRKAEPLAPKVTATTPERESQEPEPQAHEEQSTGAEGEGRSEAEEPAGEKQDEGPDDQEPAS